MAVAKIFLACIFTLMTFASFAKPCNRTDGDSSDYIDSSEICDDDFHGKKIPQFKEYSVAENPNLKPIFPSKIPGIDQEQNAKWLDAIHTTYKEHGVNFAGHFLFVIRGGCGAECHRAMIIDLETGKIFEPAEIELIMASVNDLPASLCSKLDISCNDDTYSFRKDSNLVVVVGAIGESASKRGVYHWKWENGKFKSILRVERKPFTRK
jgi:hypothetical protein